MMIAMRRPSYETVSVLPQLVAKIVAATITGRRLIRAPDHRQALRPFSASDNGPLCPLGRGPGVARGPFDQRDDRLRNGRREVADVVHMARPKVKGSSGNSG